MGKVVGGVLGSGLGGVVMGPLGAVAGGLLGGSDKMGDNLKGMIGQQGFNMQQSAYEPSLQRAIGVLQNRVDGNAPSVAQEQLKQGLDDTLSNTVSAIRSSPSVSPALQARMISRAGQDQASELSRAQAILRAGEQSQAEQSLAQTLLGARGQDLTGEAIKAGAFADKQKRRGDLFSNVIGGVGQAFMGGF